MNKQQDFKTGIYVDVNEIDYSNYAVTSKGILTIQNSGGSSSSEGGMGSGSKSDEQKGSIKSGDQKLNNEGNKISESDENTFDPVKKDIDKAQEKASE